jgi:subtilisin-like proprotein convertase family protein
MHLRDSKFLLAALFALRLPALAGDHTKAQAIHEQAPVPAFPQSSGSNGVQPLIAPACLGTQLTTHTYGTNSPAVPIFDFTTATQYVNVSGAGSHLYDIDVFVNITHTFVADLTILVTSPAGTTVTLAKHNGWQQDNVLAGTTFDESSAAYPITIYNFVDNVVATPLIPFGSLDAFVGEDPNGTWRIDVIDDWAVDSGAFWSSSLNIATVPATPMSTSQLVQNIQPQNIPDLGIVSSSVQVSGLPTTLESIRVHTDITHPFSADLQIWLQSPSGTVASMVTYPAAYANAFANTDWVEGELNADKYVYTNPYPAPAVAPNGSFGALRGEDPNGTWRLFVYDQYSGNVGTLNSWWLEVTTCHGSLESYCPSGTSWSNGCNAQMHATGVCSASKTSGFVLYASQVEAFRTGLIFYGESGRQMTPWHPMMNTQLCVRAPTQRTTVQDSGGLAGATCSGEISVDWLAFMHANPGALGNPLAPGTLVQAQCWYRDPASPKTTNLSDAIEFSVIP